MSLSCRSTVQSLSLFEAHGDLPLPTKIDDFLNSGATGSLCDEHSIDRSARLQGLTNRMYSNQDTHDLDVTVIEITNFSRDIQ